MKRLLQSQTTKDRIVNIGIVLHVADMETRRKTHHEMIREALTELKEARPKAIIEYIRNKYPNVDVKESSFRADIIGCSINHSSSHHYPGMPKLLFFEKQKKTYRLYDSEKNRKGVRPEAYQKVRKLAPSEIVVVTDDDVRVGRELLRAFNNGIGIFADLASEAVNDIGLDRDLYLNYVTFTSAIDYQKNIKANDLWRATKRWAEKYPWLFKPEELMNKTITQVVATFKQIRTQESRIFRIGDIGIWLLIADALLEYDGKTSKLLENFDSNAWRIYSEFTGRLKKRFPFLSGDKILPMWLKILSEDAEVKLKNMEKLPLPVDKNVAEATFNLILKKSFQGIVDKRVKETVRNVWRRIADRLNVPVISFDTPLWTLGGIGCSDPYKARCIDCPVSKHCYVVQTNAGRSNHQQLLRDAKDGKRS